MDKRGNGAGKMKESGRKINGTKKTDCAKTVSAAAQMGGGTGGAGAAGRRGRPVAGGRCDGGRDPVRTGFRGHYPGGRCGGIYAAGAGGTTALRPVGPGAGKGFYGAAGDGAAAAVGRHGAVGAVGRGNSAICGRFVALVLAIGGGFRYNSFVMGRCDGMADVTDSKSVGSDTVWVRVPPPAPNQYNPNQIFLIGDGFGLFVFFEKFEDTHFRNGVVKRPESKIKVPRKL